MRRGELSDGQERRLKKTKFPIFFGRRPGFQGFLQREYKDGGWGPWRRDLVVVIPGEADEFHIANNLLVRFLPALLISLSWLVFLFLFGKR